MARAISWKWLEYRYSGQLLVASRQELNHLGCHS
jgi:hypothetical protein